MRYGYIRLCPDEQAEQLLYYKEILKTKKIDQMRIDIANYNEPVPELEKLLKKELISGDTLYITELRQLGRSLQSFLNIQEYLYEKKINLIVLNLINPTTDTSQEFLNQFQNLLSKLSKLESEQRLRRQKRAINIAKSKGQKVGRPSSLKKNKMDKIFMLYNKGKKVS